MSHEQHQGYDRTDYTSMQRAMGRGAHDAVIREALERIDGAPAPVLDDMQVAMGRESQVRVAYETIRGYLDERGLPDLDAWALERAAHDGGTLR